MWKGFRQNHPRKEDQRFCVITFVHPITGKRVYSRLNGLPFGMDTVVNQFNRLPHLKTAVLRRLLGILACHYFDDELVMDFGHIAAQTQALSHRLSEMWGIKYSPKTRHVVSIHTTFLGNSCDWADLDRPPRSDLWSKASNQSQGGWHGPEPSVRVQSVARSL